MTRTSPIIGVSLDGAGAHPAAAAWPRATDEVLDPARLVELARTAERADVDFVALNDSFDPPDPVKGELPFRLDALLSLAHVAAATADVGLVATVTTTHTEPFHVSKNVATLDLVSAGRAGWRVAVSSSVDAARRFGRKAPAPAEELVAEADEVVDVVARLWDSWEDDAVIRDRPTGRYIDRERLHYVDFEGRFFSVRGPSITPRPPQGQPIVLVDVADGATAALAATRADVALIAEADLDDARARRDALRAAAVAAGRPPDELKVVVLARLGEHTLRARLDDVASCATGRSLDLVGTADQVVATLAAWHTTRAVDGFLFQPDVLPDTLDWLVDGVLPGLRARGLVEDVVPGSTLRDRFGLARPANRYAAAEAAR